MKQIFLLLLCFLPVIALAQGMKDLSEEEVLKDKDYIALQSETKPFEEKLKAIRDEYNQATSEKRNDPDYQTTVEIRYATITKELMSMLQSFISNHPDSYISLLVLNDLSDPNSGVDSSVLTGLYNSLSDPVKKTDLGQTLEIRILVAVRTAIGALAPDFTQNDPSGKPVKLSDFRGKYVLIDFWASWCGPCRRENPFVVKAYAQFKDKNFEVLGVSLDILNSRKAWLNAIENDKMTWTQVSDLQGWKNQAARLYGVETIPQNFLIDPKGVIIAKDLRGEDLSEVLNRVLPQF